MIYVYFNLFNKIHFMTVMTVISEFVNKNVILDEYNTMDVIEIDTLKIKMK